tara:strand:- start:229 stop:1443 length:1215 start_codon:yes stop_codon:yes gene_type:complete
MNRFPLTKKEIIDFFNKQKKLISSSEIIDLRYSNGRILAQDLKSQINLPPFNNSAVDGYAIIKKDLNLKKIFTCTRRVAAGDNKKIIIKSGEAVRVFTGARMPSNSSTVVMQENVMMDGNKIRILKTPLFGDNYRLKGEDIKKNKKILLKGTAINQQNLNLIAAAGIRKIKVYKKINIGFFTNGNELRRPTNKLKNAEINNSNYYALNSLLDKNYINKKYLGNLRDNLKSVKNNLINASIKFNIIITAGGASVGDEDHLINALSSLGKIYFWRAAIKPGRPLAFGKIKKCYVVCLPGNPVSVQLLYAMLIKPLIIKLCGSVLKLPASSKIYANFNMKKKTKRMEWLRVTKTTKNKKDFANKYPKQGSGMISSVSYSSGIIEISEEISLIKKGDIFEFYDFENLF